MRKLDFTKNEDIVAFATNYTLYKDQVSLPQSVFDNIESYQKYYEIRKITNLELIFKIIEIVNEFLDRLQLKIKNQKKLDFTITEDIVEFANNYSEYKNQVSLPEKVLEELQKYKNFCDLGILTQDELINYFIRVIRGFINSL